MMFWTRAWLWMLAFSHLANCTNYHLKERRLVILIAWKYSHTRQGSYGGMEFGIYLFPISTHKKYHPLSRLLWM